MYLLIIAVIIWILVIIFVFRNEDFQDEGVISAVFFALFFIIMIISVAVGPSKVKTSEYKNLDIKSASTLNSNEFNETFILENVTISESVYYVVYGDFPEGIKRIQLLSNRCYIKESDLENPQVINYYQRKKIQRFKSRWSIVHNEDEVFYKEWTFNYKDKTIIVPKNTIYKTENE